MTIDDRLERLVERHEALAQSVEVLTHDIQIPGKLVGSVVETVARLAVIVHSHEQVLSNLEGYA